ncbi:MAG: XRE family transcriptional regulator [Chlamydiae bacterium CG10_big_fil_rev_8_21_14_0_10_35_9]|nr:MAG: XRE family transcriptional regulator [Chlamydiae bacterium CG10_big_fil_rev_8_21_14_0_10_35_9]
MKRYVISRKVGKRIRVFRRKNKLTQEEVSEKSRIHVSTLGRIERGESNPPLQTINKIAQAMKVKLNKLFDF